MISKILDIIINIGTFIFAVGLVLVLISNNVYIYYLYIGVSIVFITTIIKLIVNKKL